MNKATLIPIQPKFSKMIKDGLKNIELRNYAIPKGTKVYLYESKGKRVKGYCKPTIKEDVMYHSCNNCLAYADGEPPYDGCTRNLKISYNPPHEGQGKVVAEFKVKECYEYYGEYLTEYDNDISEICFKNIGKIAYEKDLNYQDLQNQGYTNQKYAMSIENLIVYESFEEYKGFGSVQWIDLCERNKKGYNKCVGCDYYSDNLESGCPTSETYCSKPTEPLDISEFVGWNKVDKLIKNNYSKYERKAYYTKLFNEIVDGLLTFNDKQCNLTHAPQGKVYVVEKEFKNGGKEL